MKMPTFDMTGKSVIVTGATTGIGYATAVTFANFGADVVITSRSQADCDRVSSEIAAKYGTRCLGIQADSSKAEDIDAVIDKTIKTFGKIDVLVNNAGVGGPVEDMLDTTEDDYDYVLGINLKGVYMFAKRVARHMVDRGEGGRIINISSTAALAGDGQHSVYGAAKGGVSSLTRYMAYELGKYGITVNSVNPGFTLTEILKEAVQDPTIKDIVEKRCPMRKIGDPEDIAAAVLFFASDSASFINGTQILVDGGMCTGPV